MLTSQQNKAAEKAKLRSERLFAIAESLPDKSVICDVGSDHGALPLFLLQEGKCSRAIVTDIHEKPLERAKRNLKDAGVDHLASFVLTDGIEAILPEKPDAIVIAGMGGETIVGILQRGLSSIVPGTVFVLQPMTKVSVLRRSLYDLGFFIKKERIVSENGKFFVVIKTVYDGLARVASEKEVLLGRLSERLDETTVAFLNSLLESKERVIHGKNLAGQDCLQEEREKALIEGVLRGFHENS